MKNRVDEYNQPAGSLKRLLKSTNIWKYCRGRKIIFLPPNQRNEREDTNKQRKLKRDATTDMQEIKLQSTALCQ